MKKIILIGIIILLLIIILIVLVGAYIFFNPFAHKPETSFTNKTINKTTVGIEQINLILYNIKAYELHNVPLSSNTPKIEFIIGNEAYNTEIIKGSIITKKGEIENEDIGIIASKEEFIKILNSENLKQALQESVNQGNTRLETFAGNTKLLAKGYLSLYKEITGKSFTGDVVKILK